ncbi:MAG: NAD(P)-dependent oxidoreductase [Lachnospiraceae bacterium]|nr:NAD(P)-dependent oxidoreductase [Lachnospiraceae bacterium]
MNYKVKKAAMTGGSGPIGLALIRKLLSENIEILLFQRENSAKKIYLPQDRRLHIEYCALEELGTYIPKENDFDVFFHLGWANTNHQERNSIQKQYENVLYTCTAVEMAYKLGCHSFVGVGSQAEYGRHSEALREDTLCMPENPYGIIKLCACHISRMLCRKYGIRYIWPRVLSGYGIYDNINSMLVSSILNSMEGKDLMFSKGEQIWDFVYLDDIANALYLLAKKGKDGAIYPIGSGKARPLREYIQILCEKLGRTDPAGLGLVPYSESQVMHLDADITKLQEDTGWVPEVEFEDGISRTIEFYKDWKITWEKEFQSLSQELDKAPN